MGFVSFASFDDTLFISHKKKYWKNIFFPRNIFENSCNLFYGSQCINPELLGKKSSNLQRMLVIHCGFVKQNFNFWSWKGEDQQIIEKSGFLGAKSLISYGFLKEVIIKNPPFQNTLSWNPETGFKWKKKMFFSFCKFFDQFFTFMKILINFTEFESCLTAEFFLKSIVTSWNIQIFWSFFTELKSMIYCLPFETFPVAIAFFL